MRVVIDCFKQIKGAGKSRGIYNFASNLVKNLAKYKQKKNETELVIIGNKYNREDFDFPGVIFISEDRFDPLKKMHCIIWELFGVSMMCKKLQADQVIFPRGFCALTHSVQDTIIIHDLIPFYYNEFFPNTFNRIENAYVMMRLKASAKSCHRVITVSQASSKDIVKYCGINENRITIIHNGCNEITCDNKNNKFAEPYICAMTSDLPHKNAKGIFEAYKKYIVLAKKPYNLVVIGTEDTGKVEFSEEEKRRITCYKTIKKDAEMYSIIANSTVFLFLSLIEGFGFPPIEAMQLNVPVICSNSSCLPEIVGNAARLVDPEDSQTVAEVLNSLLSDEKQRKMLIQLGKENVKRFSWDSRAKLYWKAILN